MTIFEILVQKLESANMGSAGSTIFVESMPPKITEGIMLKTPLDGIPVDVYLPGKHRGVIQVVNRDVEINNGYRVANEIARVLSTMGREQYTGLHIDVMYPETLPIKYPNLVGDGLEFSQHFRVCFGIEPHWK